MTKGIDVVTTDEIANILIGAFQPEMEQTSHILYAMQPDNCYSNLYVYTEESVFHSK